MGEIKLRDFQSQILYFNGMYKLPIAPYPTINSVAVDAKKSKKSQVIDRLEKFKHTLSEEVREIDDILDKLRNSGSISLSGGVQQPEYEEIELLTDLADWLGDVQVYCASEMAKFGIPLKETLAIIMSSNFSKLGTDGEAIYDVHGKVQKGPGYWKPEPQLKQMLLEHIEEAIAPAARPDGIVWREQA